MVPHTPEGAYRRFTVRGGARAVAQRRPRPRTAATCATTQGEGLVVVTIVNESDQYKTAAVVCYCKSAQARSVDGVLENVHDRADAYYERLPSLTPARPAGAATAGPALPGEVEGLCRDGDLPPRSRRVALAVVRSGSQYELRGHRPRFYDAAPPQKGQQRIDAFVRASKSRTALDADGLFAAVALPEGYTEAAVAADDDLEEALRRSQRDNVSTTTSRTSPKPLSGRAIATTTCAERCAGRARTRRRARPGRGARRGAPAVARDVAPPRRDVVQDGRTLPIVLDDSQDDNVADRPRRVPEGGPRRRGRRRRRCPRRAAGAAGSKMLCVLTLPVRDKVCDPSTGSTAPQRVERRPLLEHGLFPAAASKRRAGVRRRGEEHRRRLVDGQLQLRPVIRACPNARRELSALAPRAVVVELGGNELLGASDTRASNSL